jgi:hypothetical protein
MGTGHFVAPKTLEVRLNEGGTRELAGEPRVPQRRNARGNSERSKK